MGVRIINRNSSYSNYYISNSGNSGNSGNSPSSPIPVSKLLTTQLNKNDRIYFNKGETFNLGSFDINVDGISILAYGSGASPVIDGSTSVSSNTWTSDGAGNYYTSMASMPGWVWINQTAAIWAKSAFIPVTTVADPTNIIVSAATINALPSSIIGASMFGKENSFRVTVGLCAVTGYNSGTGQITFTGTLNSLTAGMPIVLNNQIQFLTNQGDWCWDSSTLRLYVKSTTSPAGTDITIGNNDYAFNFGTTSNWTVDGIEFVHYIKYAIVSNNQTNILTRSNNITIQNCPIHETRGDGVRIFGYAINVNIYNNTFYNCALRAIEVGGVNSGSITYNTIYQIDYNSSIPTLSLGNPFDFNQTGGTGISPGFDPSIGSSRSRYTLPNNLTIDHNLIHDMGYQGMQIFGSNFTITKNHIYNFNGSFNDGGGIHLYYNNVFQGRTRNNLIQSNIVHDGIGNNSGIVSGGTINTTGLYQDNGCSDNTWDSNFSYNNQTMQFFANSFTINITCTNNKLGSAASGRQTCAVGIDNSINGSFPFRAGSGFIWTGNTMFTNAVINYTYVGLNNGSIIPFSTLDNNYYVNPYTNICVELDLVGTKTLAQWQAFTGMDASSVGIFNYLGPPQAGDYGYKSNPSDSPITFNPGAGYKDASTNTNISGNVTIPAWGGLIYIKQ